MTGEQEELQEQGGQEKVEEQEEQGGKEKVEEQEECKKYQEYENYGKQKIKEN